MDFFSIFSVYVRTDRQTHNRREPVPALLSVLGMQVIIAVTLPGYTGNNCGDIPSTVL